MCSQKVGKDKCGMIGPITEKHRKKHLIDPTKSDQRLEYESEYISSRMD